MKKWICAVILIIVGVLLCTTVYAKSNIRVYVNRMRVNEDVILQNDRTYVPLRAVSEALGADVDWDDASKTVNISFTEDNAVAKIVADVSPSVVTIVGNADSASVIDRYNNPTMHGSGVIYKSSGYIVTNAHVVRDIKNLTVVFNDGVNLPGSVLFADEDADLAIVKTDRLGLSPISMADKDTVFSGITAIAIGTPISLSMRNTVTKGIVSGNGVQLHDSYYKLIQTDTTINPGNSGGPLLNARGELIGINTSKYVSPSIDNMAFAIPVDTVEYVISQYERNGYIKRPKLDIELEQSWEAKIGLPTNNGITVLSFKGDSLLPGDIIRSVNGITVHSIVDWNEAIKETYDGVSLRIGYTRNGVTGDTEIKA